MTPRLHVDSIFWPPGVESAEPLCDQDLATPVKQITRSFLGADVDMTALQLEIQLW